MKALRIAAGVAAAAGVLAIAGCPLIGLPGPTTTPFPGFDSSKAKLTGRFIFGGDKPPTTLTAKYKVPSGDRASETASTDASGYFFFTGTTAGEYQIVWDDGGEEIKDAKVNTVNVYVSDPVTSPPTQFSTEQVKMDLKWEPLMKPEPSGTLGADGKFTFTSMPSLTDPEYQIAIFTNPGKTAVNTLTATAGTATWDKKKTDGTTVAAGDYFYQIKFFKKGGTFGGKNYYGQMKFISFKVQ